MPLSPVHAAVTSAMCNHKHTVITVLKLNGIDFKGSNSAIFSFTFLLHGSPLFKSFTTKKEATKFSSAKFQKIFKSQLYHIENSKTRGQTM